MFLKNSKNQYLISTVDFAAESCPEAFVEYSEKMYSARLAETLFAAFEKKILLISGPSASGKTTSAKKLAAAFEKLGKRAVVVSMDDFYKHRTEMPVIDGKINAEVIESVEISLLEEKMNEFALNGKSVLPVYDFATGRRRDGANPVEGEIMIVEGLHALNPLVRDRLGDAAYSIYVSPHSGYFLKDGSIDRRELRFLRRLVRDYYHRASPAERTFEMWDDVSACEDVYIRPLGKTADKMLDTTHPYEICVLKSEAEKILATVGKDSPYYAPAERLLKLLSSVTPLPLSVIPEGSLLHEFLPQI
mgnify:FL=1